MNEISEAPSYSVHVTGDAEGFIANIPELAVAARGRTAQEALSLALEMESQARSRLAAAGVALPPAGTALDPLPRVTGFARRSLPFVGRVVAGFFIVVLMLGAGAAVAYPSVRARVRGYLGGEKMATGVNATLAKAGVGVCRLPR